MMKQIERNIGHVIKIMRIAAGIKQKDLALRAGIKANYLSLVEAGKREPSLNVLREIARVLNVPMSLLFWESEDMPRMGSTKEEDALMKLKRLVLEMETLRMSDQRRAIS